MTQHKWHKEIKAWADGADIEARYKDQTYGTWTEWAEMSFTCRFSEDDWWEYRIKPQPKEPQYLYVWQAYSDLNEVVLDFAKPTGILDDGVYKLAAKIKLEEV